MDGSRVRLDYIEIIFQDQYLGRSDMWRLGKQLQEKCVYAGQALDFVGSPTGKIHALYIDGKNVRILSELHFIPLLTNFGRYMLVW